MTWAMEMWATMEAMLTKKPNIINLKTHNVIISVTYDAALKYLRLILLEYPTHSTDRHQKSLFSFSLSGFLPAHNQRNLPVRTVPLVAELTGAPP